MNYLKGRVSYLKGLAEGMKMNDSTNEGKLLLAIIEVLEDVAIAVDDVEEVQEQLSEQIDSIDEDLSEVENTLYDDEDECGCGCNEEEEDSLGEVECPHCGQLIEINDEMFDEDKDTLTCPSCGKEIEVEWECECGECHDHKHE